MSYPPPQRPADTVTVHANQQRRCCAWRGMRRYAVRWARPVARVREHFSWDEKGNELKALYDEIAAEVR